MNKNRILSPVVFSAIIGLIAFIANLTTRQSGAASSDAWMPVFFSFLPLCFFMIAGQIRELQKQNNELRREVEAIKSRTSQSAS